MPEWDLAEESRARLELTLEERGVPSRPRAVVLGLRQMSSLGVPYRGAPRLRRDRSGNLLAPHELVPHADAGGQECPTLDCDSRCARCGVHLCALEQPIPFDCPIDASVWRNPRRPAPAA